MRKTIEKMKKPKSWFFKKINKTYSRALARLTKKKKERRLKILKSEKKKKGTLLLTPQK